MDEKVAEIAERIKGLREMSDITDAEMATAMGLSLFEYQDYEQGSVDFNFTFLHKAAQVLEVDITELIRGDAPNLNSYTVERAGCGLPITRRAGFKYLHKASNFKNRIAEPFVVEVPFFGETEKTDIVLNRHQGQEIDFILEGSLKIVVDGHEEILNEGDCIYYNSEKPHGMVATGGETCKFLAIVF